MKHVFIHIAAIKFINIVFLKLAFSSFFITKENQ